MKQNPFKAAFVVVIAVFLAACTPKPQNTVYLDSDLFFSENAKIGFVYVEPEGEATTHIYGADCLLCIGFASALTSSLDNHLEATISSQELQPLADFTFAEYAVRSDLVEQVEMPVSLKDMPDFSDKVGFAKKDFRNLKAELGVDMLAVLHITSHGAVRTFSSYVPTSDPKGFVQGVMYLVNLDDNSLVQYKELDTRVLSVSQWDEAPTFPGVTTSYYQAIENTKGAIKNAF